MPRRHKNKAPRNTMLRRALSVDGVAKTHPAIQTIWATGPALLQTPGAGVAGVPEKSNPGEPIPKRPTPTALGGGRPLPVGCPVLASLPVLEERRWQGGVGAR